VSSEVRQVALNCTVKKHAYRQTQDGIVVSFLVHHAEMPAALASADLGTPYVMALVEVDENDQPAKEPVPVSNPPVRVGRHWRDMPATAQAAIRCNELAFQRYLGEKHGGVWRLMNDGTDAMRAAALVRWYCDVSTRKDIVFGTAPGDKWFRLDNEYQAWLQM
jgi:hypothetical protein